MGGQKFKISGKEYPSMGRKEEFQFVCEKYSDVPKNFILKTDLLRRGVTLSREALIRLQDPFFEHAPWTLFQWHHEDQTESYGIPGCFHLKDATYVGLIISPPEEDPYYIDLLDDKFWIFSDGEPLEEIFWSPRPNFYDKTTGSGLAMQAVAFLKSRDVFFVIPYRHCHFWNEGLQCKFCDMDYNTKHQMKMGRWFKTRANPQDIYEAAKEALKAKGKWRHICLTGGSHPGDNFNRELDIYLESIKAVKDACKEAHVPDRLPIAVFLSPLDEDQNNKLYEAGVSAIYNDMEVWDEGRFKLICPGKQKHIGWKKWIEKMNGAVEIFGEGNVSSIFVTGVEMSPPPYGFDDVDQAINSTLDGWKYLLDRGVVPTSANWSIVPGSYFYKIGAKQPPLEFYVKLDRARHHLMKNSQVGLNFFFECYMDEPWSASSDWRRLL
ncbi:MAG: radical SAM protein [Thermodesulfobacteriota bacterium]|nr:radical SAM protein [Thermodesulfobacteriota bacterium]